MIRSYELRIADCGLRISAAFRIRNPIPAGRGNDAPAKAGAEIRNRWYPCLFVVLSLAGSVSARYGNPAAGGPINRGTVPPSSYQSGMVNVPNPVDSTNNLVVTGNVSGGKAFRGNIPYNSTTSFGAPLGSTSLDPFLRYSAIPQELSDGSTTYSPFYSPTGTVSKIQPGYSSAFAPGSPKVAVGQMACRAEQPADVMTLPETSQIQTSTGQADAGADASTVAWPGSRSLPLSKTPEEMRRIVSGDPTNSLAERRPLSQGSQIMTPEEYQQQLEQLQRDFDRVKTNASQFEQDLKTGKQAPVQALEQKPVDAVEPLVSAEALRKIMQPQPPSPLQNPPAGQDSPGKPDRVSQPPSYPQPIRPASGSDSLDGGFLQTPRIAMGDLIAPQPGQTQGQAAGALSDLAILSPQSPPEGISAGASTETRLRLYGQPARRAETQDLASVQGRMMSLQPSSSELSAQQKSRINAIFAPQIEGAAVDKSSDNGSKLPAMQRVEETARAFDAPARILEHPLQNSTGNVLSSTVGGIVDPQARSIAPGVPVKPASSLPNGTKGRPQASLERATGPGRGQPKSPSPSQPPIADRTGPRSGNVDSSPQDELGRCMKAAELSMQQGQYSRAAESYAIACVYNPKDVRPLIGRCHALLAAGEYLNSAECLVKAIELDPRNTLKKSDLIEGVGGPDLFVQRITDLEQRAKTSDAPGLQLLLAYIYQQMDRSQQATAAIRAAKKGMPSSKPVALLEAAISARG
jgi:tetratricopeptide (TPR) repeat protein